MPEDSPQTGAGSEAASPANSPVAGSANSPVAGSAGAQGPWPRRAGEHVRKYAPYYALGVAWAIMLTLFPTVRPQGAATDLRPDRPEVAGSTSEGATDVSIGSASSGQNATDVQAAGVRRTGSGGRTGAPRAVSGTGGPLGKVTVGAGVTRGGFECRPGVRQLPWSQYAAPCEARFTGENGGSTYRGVTKDKVVIANRFYPSNANQETLVNSICATGNCPTPPSAETAKKVKQTFLDYFNKSFELHGRQVELVDFEANPQADQFAELRGEGQEGACADATKITDEIKAFAATNGGGVGAAAFDECAAQRKLISLTGAYGAPEQFYQRLRPYAWQTTMSCSRLSHLIPEYVGKRLNGRLAKWAGDPLYRAQPRVFGSIKSNITVFDPCLELSEREARRYNIKTASTYTYVFDPSRYAEDAARAAVQFKAAGVSSLIISADMLFMIFLTQQANNQRWYPEWVIIGSGYQDVETYVRLWDQGAVEGHLFGMSQLGSEDKLLGPSSEPAVTYKRITGQEIPANTQGSYWNLLWVFNMLQMAGPNLTPDNVERGVFSYPRSGGARAEVGTWDFGVAPDGTPGYEHTAIDDSREVYWDRAANKYIETYGGKRFTNGQWPAEEPPVYPPK